MAVQSEIGTLAGFDYWNGHVIGGGTFYMGLFLGSLFPVGNAVVTHSSTVGTVTECSGTGYARQSFTMGASTNGIMVIPQVVFSNGANAWSATCALACLCSAASAGTAIYWWDLSAVRDMSVVGSTLTITSPPLNIFIENPGGI